MCALICIRSLSLSSCNRHRTRYNFSRRAPAPCCALSLSLSRSPPGRAGERERAITALISLATLLHNLPPGEGTIFLSCERLVSKLRRAPGDVLLLLLRKTTNDEEDGDDAARFFRRISQRRTGAAACCLGAERCCCCRERKGGSSGGEAPVSPVRPSDNPSRVHPLWYARMLRNGLEQGIVT